MASIQSLGIGSGVLTNDVVDKIIAAERKPVDARLKLRREDLNVKISAYGTLTSSMGKLQSAVSSLTSPSAMSAKTASSSKEATLSATASSLAPAGSYSVEVVQTAQAHQLTSQNYASLTAPIGTGTLTFRFGTTTYDANTDAYTGFSANVDKGTRSLTIDSSNNSLVGIRDAINRGNFGVTAAIVDTGSGYQLSMTSSETGAKNSLEVTATDSDANNTDTLGISAFTFSSASTNMNQSAVARDSTVKINGVSVSRSNNYVTGAINGVTLNLKQSDPGTSITVNVQPDTTTILKRVQGFVDAYNEIATQYKELTKFDTKTRVAGPLLGDSTLRNIMNQIRNVFTNVVPGLGSGAIRGLGDLGIDTDKATGQLKFNSDKFTAALAANPSDVTAAFATRGTTTDSLVSYAGSSSATLAGTYAINVTTLATQASYNGAGVIGASTTIDSTNNTFSISVNGTTSGTITLTQNTYTTTQLVQEIQSKINGDATLKAANAGVTVAFDNANNRLTFTSSRYGSSSTIAIASVGTTSAATLGLSVGTGTAGTDVAGTINGATATGLGQRLTAPTGDAAAGLSVDITAGTTGSRGTVSFVRGAGDRLNTLVSQLVGSGGTLGNKSDALNKEMDLIDADQKKLDLRMTREQTRLQTQFAAYDVIVKQLNSTSDFLTKNFATKSSN